MTPQAWTEERVDRFIDLWNSGASIRTISAELNTHRNTVHRFRASLGLEPRRPNAKKESEPPVLTKNAIIAQDVAFCLAMGAAIEAGLESAHIGVITTPDLEWGILRVTPAASHVRTQSVAADCVANGVEGKESLVLR